MESISYRYFNGTQSVEFEGLYKIEGEKIRIKIDRDSYDAQCSARAHIFDPKEKKWNFLTSIPYSDMLVVKNDVFCYRKVGDQMGEGLTTIEINSFRDDVKMLISQTIEILQ